MMDVVGPIYTATADARRVYAGGGRQTLREADTLRQPELADSFEALHTEGADLFYRGALAEAIVETCGAGGHLRLEDLARYRTLRRTPLSLRYRGTGSLDESAAVDRRHVDRPRARTAGNRRGDARDGARPEHRGGHAARERRASRSRRLHLLRPRARPRTRLPVSPPDARPGALHARNDPHQRRRRRGQPRRHDGIQRRRLRPPGAGHGDHAEQHARRGGPEPRRLPSLDPGHAARVDDGADVRRRVPPAPRPR